MQREISSSKWIGLQLQVAGRRHLARTPGVGEESKRYLYQGLGARWPRCSCINFKAQANFFSSFRTRGRGAQMHHAALDSQSHGRTNDRPRIPTLSTTSQSLEVWHVIPKITLKLRLRRGDSRQSGSRPSGVHFLLLLACSWGRDRCPPPTEATHKLSAGIHNHAWDHA